VKVLVAHNRYRSELPSGENVVVDEEIAALRRAGVEVVPYLRSSDEIRELPAARKIAVPLLPVHSPRAVAEVRELIRRHGVDVLHLHNPYPFISMSVVAAAHGLGVPVVMTLHNHRHSCVRGSYFRDGQPCTLCRGKALPWPAVQHGCYRDSRLQSVPMAAALRVHRRDQRAVDRYVALTDSVARSIEESGLVRPGQVVVRPNSVPDPGPTAPPGRGLLFVGRLTPEKGVPLLLEAWERAGRPFGSLRLAGEGPVAGEVEAAVRRTGGAVTALGRLDAAGVAAAMRSAAAVVVPSTAPEGMPLVVLEAFAHGRPVVATRGRGLDLAVTPSVGWLSEPTVEDLARVLAAAAADDPAAKGAAARATYERTYSPDVVVAAQLRIYREVIEEAGRSRPAAPGRGHRG
jgi:glycosyltransferase involved in cell wall biosynthesis